MRDKNPGHSSELEMKIVTRWRTQRSCRCSFVGEAGPISTSTLYRWYTHGIRGVFLETEIQGGMRNKHRGVRTVLSGVNAQQSYHARHG